MTRGMGARVLGWGLPVLLLMGASTATAKDHGVRTPGGRNIYGSRETFGEVRVLQQESRFVIIEVATGLAPEGQLAASLGFLVGKLEFYFGVGLQFDPSRQLAVSSRYWFDIHGFEPFVALGYVNQNHTLLDMTTHHVFSEVGYKWRWARTYHFTLGLGARYIAATSIADDSTLRGPDVDPQLLREQRDDVFPLMPTLSLRFSRAF